MELAKLDIEAALPLDQRDNHWRLCARDLLAAIVSSVDTHNATIEDVRQLLASGNAKRFKPSDRTDREFELIAGVALRETRWPDCSDGRQRAEGVTAGL